MVALRLACLSLLALLPLASATPVPGGGPTHVADLGSQVTRHHDGSFTECLLAAPAGLPPSGACATFGPSVGFLADTMPGNTSVDLPAVPAAPSPGSGPFEVARVTSQATPEQGGGFRYCLLASILGSAPSGFCAPIGPSLNALEGPLDLGNVTVGAPGLPAPGGGPTHLASLDSKVAPNPDGSFMWCADATPAANGPIGFCMPLGPSLRPLQGLLPLHQNIDLPGLPPAP